MGDSAAERDGGGPPHEAGLFPVVVAANLKQRAPPTELTPAPAEMAFSSYRPPEPGKAVGQVHAPLRAAQLQEYFQSSSENEEGSSGYSSGPGGGQPVAAADSRQPGAWESRRETSATTLSKKESRKKKRKRDGKEKRSSCKHSKHKRHRHDADKVQDLERRHNGNLRGQHAGGRPPLPGGNFGGNNSELFFFDTHGDKDNLAYDSLYRGETPAYRSLVQGRSRHKLGVYGRHGPACDTSLAEGAGSGIKAQRYFSASQARQERDRSSVRTRFHRSNPASRPPGQRQQQRGGESGWAGSIASPQTGHRLQLPLPAVLPVEAGTEGSVEPNGVEAVAVMESVEEYIRRRTREFNEAVREEPWNLQAWLDYAAFQDQAVMLRQTRKLHLAEVSVAEKKLSILEKALQHIPSSEKLLLAFMDAMSVMATRPQLLTRWQRLLQQHGAAMPGLWERYLQLERGSFSDFRLAKLSEAYVEAVTALAGQAARLRREEAPCSELLKVEEARVGFVLQAVQAWLQGGYTERAVAAIQAALEFSAFSPPFPPSMATDASKAREFRRFWQSGAPRIGEEGAAGWSRWTEGPLHRQEEGKAPSEGLQDTAHEETGAGLPRNNGGPEEGDGGNGGAWSEWRDLGPADKADGGQDGPNGEGHNARAEQQTGGDGKGAAPNEQQADGKAEGIEGKEETEEEETEEELMARLGMKLEAGLGALGEQAGISPATLTNWLEQEVRRSSSQWGPVPPGPEGGHEGNAEAEEGKAIAKQEVEVERLLELEDVSSFLVSLDHSLDVREQLALGCCVLLGAPLGRCLCSNSRISHFLGSTSDSFSDADCRAVCAALPIMAGNMADWQQGLAWLLPPGLESCTVNPQVGPPWETEAGAPGSAWWEADSSRMDFLRRLVRLLVTGPLSGQPALARALFRLEAAASARGGGSKEGAKAVLADRREDLALWGAYAAVEAENRRFKSARKIYAAAMASVPPSERMSSAHLFLGRAELELQEAAGSQPAAVAASGSGSLAALRVLVYLGAGAEDSAEVTRSALLSARRGFQDMLPKALQSNGGRLDHSSAALIMAAILFEALAPPSSDSAEAPASDTTGGLSSGMTAAATLFNAAVESTDSSVRRMSIHHERLQVFFARLITSPVAVAYLPGTAAASGSCHSLRVSPRAAKRAVSGVLEDFPTSPEALSIWAELHERMHHLSALRATLTGIAGRLQRGVAGGTPLLWALLLRVESRRPGGRHRVHGTLESCLASSSSLRSCPVLWRIYLAHHLAAGQLEQAHRVFLRAIHECPSSKALWLDGFAGLRSHLSSREAGELLDICRDKEVFLRTDIFEVLLAGIDSELDEEGG
mmetsp:Transcript_37311/g.105267  ORF Transcript_37311/g.105267 Transcript_37311/m.105267 type:complete len:1342 (-) Transcript_37311:420-4445(-)